MNIGPDFYKCFLEDANFFSLYEDNIHLNGLGTDVSSHLWHEILTGARTYLDPCTIPRFVLHNLEPSTVAPWLKQNLIEIGDNVYTDAPYTLSALPAGLGLETGVWVMTANADAGNTGNPTTDPYITFDVDSDVTVYIAYDIDTSNPAETLPDWMISSGYTEVSPASEISLSGVTRPYRLYSATVSAPATITLGGNHATGAAGLALNNYLVIVVEN
jgi:hypothetical protein